MKYCLESDNKYLAFYRKHQPIDDISKNHIKRSDTLLLREAIFAHYEINPSIPSSAEMPKKTTGSIKIEIEGEQESIQLNNISISNPRELLYLSSFMSENDKYTKNLNLLFEKLGFPKDFLNYQSFLDIVDWNTFRIFDSFNRSILAGNIKLLSDKNPAAPIKKIDYVKWACDKGLLLPSFMTDQVDTVELPTLQTLKDVKSLDFKNLSPPMLCSLGCNVISQLKKRNDPKTKISEIYNSSLVKKLLEECKKAENSGKIKAEDTFREYIENQFLENSSGE